MLQSLQRVLILTCFWSLAGCQSMAHKTAPEPAATPPAEPLTQSVTEHSPPTTPAGATELTEDIVFNLLAGEVATQRGALDEAYDYQLEAARLSGDAKSAERATRLALHMERDDLATEAAALWVELAPTDLTARQLIVILMLRQDENAPVLEHLKAIVQISEKQDGNGFLNAMAAINRELKRDVVMGWMRRLALAFPDDPRGGYALAITALVEKDFSTAEKEANQLIEAHPDWPKGYLVLSRIHLARGDKAQAQALLADAVDRFAEDPLLRSAYARLLVDAKKYQLAYEQFQVLEQIEQGRGDSSYWMGLIALEQGRNEVARKHFLHLMSLDKRTDLAAYYLGRIAEDADQPKQAIDWYQRAEGGEFNDEAQVRVVRLMADQGAIGEALEWLQRKRIQYPDQSVRLYLIEVSLLRDHGTPEQVMALFDKAINAMPGNSDLLYARGLYAASQNRLDILERDMLQVIDSDPENADALNALGYTLADQTDRHQEALDYIQRALALKPDSAAILDSMGWVMFRMGRLQEALEYLQRAFAKLPDPEIAAHLGEVLWMTGDHQQAQQIWQGVLKESPDNEHVLEVMRRLKI